MISGGSSWWCVTKLYTSAFTSDFSVFSLHFCLSPRHYNTEIIRIAGQSVFLLFRNDGQSFWNEIFPECAKTFWGPRKKGYKQLPWETEIFFIQPISDLGDNPGWNWTLHGWKGNAWIIVILYLESLLRQSVPSNFWPTLGCCQNMLLRRYLEGREQNVWSFHLSSSELDRTRNSMRKHFYLSKIKRLKVFSKWK